jgi:hypothetical protein
MYFLVLCDDFIIGPVSGTVSNYNCDRLTTACHSYRLATACHSYRLTTACHPPPPPPLHKAETPSENICFFSNNKNLEKLNIENLCLLNILPLGKFYLWTVIPLQQETGASGQILCATDFRQNVAFFPFIALNFNWPTNRAEVAVPGVTSGHTKHWQSIITLQMLRLTCIMFKIQSVPHSKHSPSLLYKPVS